MIQSLPRDADLVLASASPRRLQLLRGIGLTPCVRPVNISEIPRTDESPLDYARRLACEKALAGVYAREGDDPRWVLGCDTVVTVEGSILGKPTDNDDAIAKLRHLSGRRHEVITAWALATSAGIMRVDHTATGVRFRVLSDAEIEAYVATGEPADKAGAYGIQGGAGVFVEAIDGSYDGVVGLPLAQVAEGLVEAGVVDGFPFGVGGRAAVIASRVASAARAAGRCPTEIVLVGVSKRQPITRLRSAWAAGLANFGENYVQEWREKAFQLGPGPAWHFIGRLQRNKARFLGGRISVVHTLDSPNTAEALGKSARAHGRVIDVLAQVNPEGEVSKGGLAPEAVPAFVETLRGIGGIRPVGLMTMPPAGNLTVARRCFERVRDLRDAISTEAAPLPELSMGMTSDFEVAVACGSTMVRVGTAIFGSRPAVSH